MPLIVSGGKLNSVPTTKVVTIRMITVPDTISGRPHFAGSYFSKIS